MIITLCSSISPDLCISFDTIVKNLHIIDSYQIQSKSQQKLILEELNQQIISAGETFNRTLISQVNEWAAHNVLYGLGIAGHAVRSPIRSQ